MQHSKHGTYYNEEPLRAVLSGNERKLRLLKAASIMCPPRGLQSCDSHHGLFFECLLSAGTMLCAGVYQGWQVLRRESTGKSKPIGAEERLPCGSESGAES